MKYEVQTPKVTLLGQFNSIADAWMVSRPHLSKDDQELHALEKLDLPVQGFAQFAFNIEGSIAMRELMYLIRPNQCWAQSMRTIDLQAHNCFISSEVEDLRTRLAMCDKFDNFLKVKKAGTPQDLCKNLLPTGMMTGFSCSLDSRTLANVYKGLKRLAPHLYKAYMIPINEIMKKEMGIDLETFPGKDFILEDLMVTELDKKALKEGPFKMGRMNIVGGKMQLVLAAQAIRKQYDKVYSDIVPAILDGSIYDKDQTEEYNTILYLTDSSLKFMQSTRTCFFAKYDHDTTDSWSSVLKIEHLSVDDFRAQLPCKGSCKKCPFRAEQLARIIAGNDKDYDSLGEVNPPCPILVGTSATQGLRKFKFDSDSKIHTKWDEMLDVYPENELTQDGKDYLKNINKYGFAEEFDNKPGRKEVLLELANKGNKEYVESL